MLLIDQGSLFLEGNVVATLCKAWKFEEGKVRSQPYLVFVFCSLHLVMVFPRIVSSYFILFTQSLSSTGYWLGEVNSRFPAYAHAGYLQLAQPIGIFV